MYKLVVDGTRLKTQLTKNSQYTSFYTLKCVLHRCRINKSDQMFVPYVYQSVGHMFVKFFLYMFATCSE